MVNVAIVGLGFMGRTHFECYAANNACRVAAVVEPETARRQSTAVGGNLAVGQTPLDISNVTFHDHWQSVLADPSIHLIDICTPTHTHAEVALAALRAGKHVFVEKPMSRDLHEAEQMAAESRRTGKVLHVGHVLRYWGQYVEAKKIAEKGTLGPLRYARFIRHGGKPVWAAGNWLTDPAKSGGAILDMHIHDVDSALWMFGQPKDIAVVGRSDGNLPMSIDATWRYPTGAQIQLHGRWDHQPKAPFRFAFTIEFERGSLYCDLASGANLRLFQGDAITDLAYETCSGYQVQINDVIDSIASNKRETQVAPESALETMRMTLRHLEQAQSFAGRHR
jgi:predicted dehydrogenase